MRNKWYIKTVINENITSWGEVVKSLGAVFSILVRGQAGSLSSWGLLTWRQTDSLQMSLQLGEIGGVACLGRRLE